MPKIMKSTIDALMKEPPKTVLRDSDLKGFQARRTTTGVTYHFEYRTGGRESEVRRIKIGRHSGAMTPDQARDEAKSHVLAIASRRDPAAERSKSKKTPTLAEYAKTLLDAAEAVAIAHPENAKLTKKTIGTYRSYMRVHIGPAFGKLRLDQIASSDVLHFHNTLSKTNPATANRCRELISSLYGSAAVAGLVPRGTNPTFGVGKNKENARERFLSDDELMALGSAITVAETTGIPYPTPQAKPGKKAKHIARSRPPYIVSTTVTNALRVLILTGRRLREILHARWTDIDFERNILTIFTKAGRRNLHMPEPAMDIIRKMPRLSGYVFPQEKDKKKPLNTLDGPWNAIRRYCGLVDVRLHDLRHSFASVTISGGASLPVVGKLLGHTNAKTTQRYAHLADNPVREALAKAAAHISSAIGNPVTEDASPERT
ncbi:site-specific integrase [Pararhizobium sp. YC-54]|uniref:tyrosine-type recombinase/integrase n=1 Tax=Pararhizobium sp. YC-54 TaxID=2986920 RepID=UPI0021F7B25F|nr:site-specific integrase [Pararhizobium sp. YC-54]MCW0001347.1 site-specific integrase [Pararhizobium sp. YC-54]